MVGECSLENSEGPCKFSHCAWHNEAFSNGFALIGFMLPMLADRVANWHLGWFAAGLTLISG